MTQGHRSGKIVAAALAVACATSSDYSVAATIVAPVSASATSVVSSGNSYSINNTINQSGLSQKYKSGETDFGNYLAGRPTHTSSARGNEWFSQDYGRRSPASQTVTYGFGALTSINGFALWNEEFAGIGTAQLLSSQDGINFKPLITIKPVASKFAPAGRVVPYLAQVFSFDLTDMLFFRLLITACAGGPDFRGCGIGEVAFSSALRPPSSTPAVPVPAALPLLGSALGIFAWIGRRQKNRN